MNRLTGEVYSPSALGRKPEEVIASDLVASSFPADVGEGGVNLIFPLVAAVEYVYLNYCLRHFRKLALIAQLKGKLPCFVSLTS